MTSAANPPGTTANELSFPPSASPGWSPELRGWLRVAVWAYVLLAFLLLALAATSRPSQAYYYSSLEAYVRDDSNHYAYRQLKSQWGTWSGGQTYVSLIQSQGKAAYGYDFHDYNITVECWNTCPDEYWAADEDPYWFTYWNHPWQTIDWYNLGWLAGDISVMDGWCFTNDYCYFADLFGHGAGWTTCIPYYGTLGGSDIRRHPQYLVGGC
jgi:hypothetical protein